ncbi:putative serine/threonine-protein kinase PBS1-like [Capsicum annuum]|nr:putative serine/threonine-protein kinase PBS1-like [Capsicum annuum]
MKTTMRYHSMQLFGSVSRELDHFKEIPKENQFDKRSPSREFKEIEEEPETSKPGHTFDSGMGNSISISRHQTLDNASAYEICPEIKESAIRRETEGEFRSAIPPLWPTFLYGFFLLGLMGMENFEYKSLSTMANKTIGILVSIIGALVATLYKGPPVFGISPLNSIVTTPSAWAIGGICPKEISSRADYNVVL